MNVRLPYYQFKEREIEIQEYINEMPCIVKQQGMSQDKNGQICALFKFTDEEQATLFKLTWL